MKKIRDYLSFFVLLLLPLLFYHSVDTAGWISSSDIHASLEFAASLLAITAGIMVLLHFFTSGRLVFLIISVGFVLIGTEELVHAIFSLNRIWPEIPPTFKLAISSTWLTGRFILSASFFIALIFRGREIIPAKRVRYAFIYNIIGLICAASITFLIFDSPFLPKFVQLGSITKGLIELSLALLFFVAFLFYLNIYLKQQSRSPLLWSIIACIILQLLAHIFVFDSQAFYDSHWDAAHLIVLLGFLFPIYGVWGETLKLHKSSQVQVIELEKEMTARIKAEEARQESDGRFRSFFELTADMVVIADIEGYFREINPAWSKILGYSNEELVGKPFLDLILPEDREKTIQIIAEKLKRGNTVLSFENRYIRKDGSIAWLEWTAQPMQEKGLTFSIARDITERKRAEQEMTLLADIGRVIGSTLDIDVVYDRFAAETNKLINFDNLIINLIQKEENALVIAYVSGMDIQSRRKGDLIPFEGSIAEMSVRSGRALRIFWGSCIIKP